MVLLYIHIYENNYTKSNELPNLKIQVKHKIINLQKMLIYSNKNPVFILYNVQIQKLINDVKYISTLFYKIKQNFEIIRKIYD